MNKYQEALDNITETNDVDERIKYRLTLQELVEKATPMNVETIKLDKNVEIGKNMFCKGTTFLSKCSKCGAWLHQYYHKQYCGTCGQAIDWSEDEN